MPTKTKLPRGNTGGRHADPAGEAWAREAQGRWQRATNRARRAGGDFTAVEFYEAPALPDWHRPPELPTWIDRPLGRYVWGGSQRLLHDLEHATESCDLGSLAHASGVQFVHFAAELDVVPSDVADCVCMSEEA